MLKTIQTCVAIIFSNCLLRIRALNNLEFFSNSSTFSARPSFKYFQVESFVISVVLIINNLLMWKKTLLRLKFFSNFIQERFYTLEVLSPALNLAVLILSRDVLISENDVFSVFLRFQYRITAICSSLFSQERY